MLGHAARYERAERGYSAWLDLPMLILQRGYCNAGAVVELVVGVAAESTASRHRVRGTVGHVVPVAPLRRPRRRAVTGAAAHTETATRRARGALKASERSLTST